MEWLKRALRAGPVRLAHRSIDAVAEVPPLRRLRALGYERRFRSNRESNLFRGVYETFDLAAAAAPTTRPLGYDNAASAALYARRFNVQPHDYPALYWVMRALLDDGARRVLDLGGHIGIKFYAFSGLQALPAEARWTVFDLPAVTAQGAALAAEQGAGARLDFANDFEPAAQRCDVLLASGSLQYLPATLWDLLRPLPVRPKRIVINTTPVHPTRSYFTLNSIGTAFCPYRVMSENELLEGMNSVGYGLRHTWLNPGKSLQLPFERGYDVADYSGYCFERTG